MTCGFFGGEGLGFGGRMFSFYTQLPSKRFKEAFLLVIIMRLSEKIVLLEGIV